MKMHLKVFVHVRSPGCSTCRNYRWRRILFM
nr:MAG TPA: Thioredoxin [Caudoviricetes sp.]